MHVASLTERAHEDRDHRQRHRRQRRSRIICIASTTSRCSRRGTHRRPHAHPRGRASRAGRYAVDTGFIVFNHRTYPHFTALLDELGVASQASEMSFSVRAKSRAWNTTARRSTACSRSARNLLRPAFWRMMRDILRFNREAPRPARSRAPAGLTLRRLPGRAALLAAVHRALRSADGRRDLVREPRHAAAISRALPGAVLSQPRDAVGRRSAAMAHDSRRVGALRRKAHRALPRPDQIEHARRSRCIEPQPA